MTKCWNYWKLVAAFKYGNKECKGKKGFEGLCEWCGTKYTKDIESLKKNDWKQVDFYMFLRKRISGRKIFLPFEKIIDLIPEGKLSVAAKLLWKQPRDIRGRFLPPVPIEENMNKFIDEVVLPAAKENRKITTDEIKQWVAKETGEKYVSRKERKEREERLFQEATMALKNQFTSLPLEEQESILKELDDMLERITNLANKYGETAPNLGAFLTQIQGIIFQVSEVLTYYHQLSKEE